MLLDTHAGNKTHATTALVAGTKCYMPPEVSSARVRDALDHSALRACPSQEYVQNGHCSEKTDAYGKRARGVCGGAVHAAATAPHAPLSPPSSCLFLPLSPSPSSSLFLLRAAFGFGVVLLELLTGKLPVEVAAMNYEVRGEARPSSAH